MTSDTTRLYISPFNSAFQQAILSPSQAASASKFSFHSIQTFPEKSYGYFEISTEEALKLRRKFNGSILRGRKMRIEEARPENHKSPSTVGGSPAPHKKLKIKKREEGFLPGVELPSDRTVKRGWTSDQSKGKVSKQSTERSQLVFRTNLPNTVTSPINARGEHSTHRKRKSQDRVAEVKEFSNNIKYPSFLRDGGASQGGKRASEFVEGTGWIDEDGSLLEADNKRRRTRGVASPNENLKASKAPNQHGRKGMDKSAQGKQESETPSSESESKSSFMSESSEPATSEGETSQRDEILKLPSTSHRHNKKRPSATSPDITLTPSEGRSKSIHPLESIFKRPAPTSDPKGTASTSLAPIDTSFSFFDEEADIDNNVSFNMPQTPFTRRDIEGRRIRSAAPTPDTAAIGKRFSVPWKRRSMSVEDRGDGQDVDQEQEKQPIDEETTAAGEKGVNKEDAEWEKHFWEHRGEYNRSWKARRREKRKENRQVANRRARR